MTALVAAALLSARPAAAQGMQPLLETLGIPMWILIWGLSMAGGGLLLLFPIEWGAYNRVSARYARLACLVERGEPLRLPRGMARQNLAGQSGSTAHTVWAAAEDGSEVVARSQLTARSGERTRARLSSGLVLRLVPQGEDGALSMKVHWGPFPALLSLGSAIAVLPPIIWSTGDATGLIDSLMPLLVGVPALMALNAALAQGRVKLATAELGVALRDLGTMDVLSTAPHRAAPPVDMLDSAATPPTGVPAYRPDDDGILEVRVIEATVSGSVAAHTPEYGAPPIDGELAGAATPPHGSAAVAPEPLEATTSAPAAAAPAPAAALLPEPVAPTVAEPAVPGTGPEPAAESSPHAEASTSVDDAPAPDEAVIGEATPAQGSPAVLIDEPVDDEEIIVVDAE